MFRPNSVGKLSARAGRDLHGRPTYFPNGVDCPFSPVDLTQKTLKTSVRADSSATRGSADETVSTTVILIDKSMKPKNGDKFEFEGTSYEIVSTHPRKRVTGVLDHFECALQVLP
ncbi:MAG: hypothetical protein EOQ56_27690 [Mesorhizobium sp.]|nr:MAG: hypothetical protein EOQ56_27690 [Mesorhizobium sp.]